MSDPAGHHLAAVSRQNHRRHRRGSYFWIPFFGSAFLAVAFLAVSFFAETLLVLAFFTGALVVGTVLAGGFVVGALFAVVVCAGTVLAGGFVVGALFAVVVCGGAFPAGAFLAGAFCAVVLRTGTFLAGAFGAVAFVAEAVLASAPRTESLATGTFWAEAFSPRIFFGSSSPISLAARSVSVRACLAMVPSVSLTVSVRPLSPMSLLSSPRVESRCATTERPALIAHVSRCLASAARFRKLAVVPTRPTAPTKRSPGGQPWPDVAN